MKDLEDNLKSVAVDAARLATLGVNLSIFVALAGIKGVNSPNPLNWYVFRGIATSDAATYVGAAVGVNLALAAILWVLPEQKVAHAPARADAVATFAMAGVAMLQIFGSVAVAISIAQFYPDTTPASGWGPKVFVFFLALTAVALAAITTPLARTQVRAQLSLRRAEAARDRKKRDVENLRLLVNGRLSSRRARIARYVGWTLAWGALTTAGFAIPLTMHYGIGFVSGWKNALGVGYCIILFGVSSTYVFVVLGLAARGLWRSTGRLWRLVAYAAYAFVGLLFAFLITEAALVPAPAYVLVAKLLLVLGYFGLPVSSLLVAHRWQRGPGMLVMATTLSVWEKDFVRLRKSVKARRKDIARKTASGAYIRLAA